MRLTLVFSGKVKIDIRLFIAFESEERFKRNIKSCIPLSPTALPLCISLRRNWCGNRWRTVIW